MKAVLQDIRIQVYKFMLYFKRYIIYMHVAVHLSAIVRRSLALNSLSVNRVVVLDVLSEYIHVNLQTVYFIFLNTLQQMCN
jgi:hypothetical protein